VGLLPFFPQHRAGKKFFQWAEALDGPTVSLFREAAQRGKIHILLNIFEHAGAGEYYDMYEIEMQGFAFQNQVFVAAVNRVGKEAKVKFVGGSFVVDPAGETLTRAPQGKEKLLIVDCELARIEELRQTRMFLRDRRPEMYKSR